MTTELNLTQRSLYDTDFVQWIETITEKLRSHDFASVDWENVIEEIEDMGKSERRSLSFLLYKIFDPSTRPFIGIERSPDGRGEFGGLGG
jgi:Domain of unknown function DUF29